MKKITLFLIALMCLGSLGAKAAMFTASPAPVQESDKDIVITFNALESGVTALKGLSTDLYAHLGVYTTKSPNAWAYVVTDWNTNTEANTFKHVADNTYQITLSGDLRSYFGITDATETITSICVIARTADGTAQTKDYFIDVYPEGFYMDFEVPSSTVIQAASDLTFKASITQAGTIQFFVNGETVEEASNVTTLSYTGHFDGEGNTWEVKAVASNGTDTRESSATVIYLQKAVQQNYPGGTPKQGAVKNSDGSVTFCLAAPGKSNVMIYGSWNDFAPTSEQTMKYQDYNGYRYFWTTINGLDNTSYYTYYYLVDGKYKVGDPYAHLVLDHISDKWLSDDVFPDRPRYPYSKFDDTFLAVYKGDLDDYNWNVKDFKIQNPQALVIYELLLRDFTGTEGASNGDGTVRKAIEKIPYLNNLGVTAVELLPIMQFDGNNSWGYNTNSYMAPDKAYGSPDDYKEFIDKCHENGIAVILDIVFNHTPGLHPWYAMYDEGTSPFYNAVAPHDYSVYNDIKQEYPLVEQHWKDVLEYWLTVYKVDGFRFDLVKGLGDSDSYASGTEAKNQSRIDRMKRLHAHILSINPNALHINENLASPEEETPMGNDGQLQWNNQNGPAQNYAKGSSNNNLQYFLSSNCSRPGYSTVDYAESHDEQRIAYVATTEGLSYAKTDRYNRFNRIVSVGVQMLMSPGPKMIWQFGELANSENTKNSDGSNNTDPKKVSWSEYENASTIDQKCKVAVHDAYLTMNWLRRSNPDMFSEGVTVTYTNFSTSASTMRAIQLTRGTKEIVAVFNPNPSVKYSESSTTSLTVPTTTLKASNYDLYATCLTKSTGEYFTPTVSDTSSGISVALPAGGFCVLGTKNLSGVEDIIADGEGTDVQVYGGSGEIVIVGEYNNAAVYNLSGQRMSSLKVAAGIYIVNVDGNISKVAVR